MNDQQLINFLKNGGIVRILPSEMKFYLTEFHPAGDAVSRISVFSSEEERDAEYDSCVAGNYHLISKYGRQQGLNWEDCFKVDSDNRVYVRI